MHIPECYDAIRQAELREYLADLHNPGIFCGCCGDSIWLGEKYYTAELRIRGEDIIVCGDCKRELDESETILEVDAYDEGM